MSTSTTTVVKSAFWYTASNLLVKASGFLTIPIFTRLLTQAEYGQYNNFLSWTSVIGIITSMSLESTMISAKFDFKDSFGAYAFSLSILSVGTACLWWGVASLFLPQLSSLFSMDPLYVNAMFVYLVFQPIVNIFQAHQRYRFQYVASVLASIAVSLGAAVLAVALIYVLDDKLFAVVAGRVAPMVLVGVVLFALLAKGAKGRGAGRLSSSYLLRSWRYALPIALPFIPHLLSMTLLGSMNKIFIEQMVSSEANAIYSLANNCGLVISLLTTSLNGAFSPWLGEKLNEGDLAATRVAAKPYLLLFCLLALGVGIIGPELIYVLGGEAYAAAGALIPPLAMGCVFQFVYCMYVNIEQFKKKTVGMAAASVSAAAVNAALDLVLIPNFGYEAAAFATAISYGWLLLVHMLLVGRLHLLGTYDTRYNLLMLLITAALLCVVALLYSNIIARAVLGVVDLLVIIKLALRVKETL